MEKSINRKIAEHANLFKKTIVNQIANLDIDKNIKTDILRLIYVNQPHKHERPRYCN